MVTIAITLQSIVAATSNQVSCDLQEEAAILNLDSSTYYGLNGAGSFIWKTLKEPVAVHEIRDRLLAEFDVDTERVTNDLVSILSEMVDAGLIEVKE